MRRSIIEVIATGLYLGKIKFAPGTFGTLLGLPIAWLMIRYLGPLGYLVGAIVLIVISAVTAQLHEKYTNAHDPGEIVIDEVVGYVIAMTWLPVTWQSFVAAFVLFRILDIVKPPPIRQIDRRVSGGLGTTLDDVAAGLIANGLLQVVFTKTAWLGVQAHGS